MNRSLLYVALLGMACVTARSAISDDSETLDGIGGRCSWTVAEGGRSCTVESAIESRVRTVADGGELDVNEVEGYAKKQWRCGEKHEICGALVECSCPFFIEEPDGGSIDVK